MGFVKCIYKFDYVEMMNIFKDIQLEYSDVFKGLGFLLVKQDIKIDFLIFFVIYLFCCVLIVFCDKIKDEFDCMEEVGVIVQQKKFIVWVFMVIVKLNGKLCICIDFKDFNKVICREYYLFKIIEDVIQ